MALAEMKIASAGGKCAAIAWVKRNARESRKFTLLPLNERQRCVCLGARLAKAVAVHPNGPINVPPFPHQQDAGIVLIEFHLGPPLCLEPIRRETRSVAAQAVVRIRQMARIPAMAMIALWPVMSASSGVSPGEFVQHRLRHTILKCWP